MSGGFVERELAVARGLASCRGDDARLDEADAEIAKLRAECDALLEVLTELANSLPSAEYMRQQGQEEGPLLRKMRAVIAKVTGENK